MANNAHVFVVDANTFPVHRDRLFCGVKNPENDNTRHGLYADLLGIRPGDEIFFYQSRIDEPRPERGFRGVYRSASAPFFDKTDVKGLRASEGFKVLGKCPKCGSPFSLKSGKAGALGERKCPSCGQEHGLHVLPNRILIEPVLYFSAPVDDNTAYINHTNHGMLWTMLFRKTFGAGRARSVTHILPEESEKLKRLLSRVNKGCPETDQVFRPYKTPDRITARQIIELDLGEGPLAKYESTLEAWLMANLDKGVPTLSDVIGPPEELEFFGNNVLYGIGGEKVDILCLHKKAGLRFKATVIELKKGLITKDALYQIDDYGYWVGQLSTANLEPGIGNLEIQPLIIGSGAAPALRAEITSYKTKTFAIPLKKPCEVIIQRPILLEYKVRDGIVAFETIIN